MQEAELDINQIVTKVQGFLSRRRWQIGLPMVVISVAVAGFVGRLPNIYKSRAAVEIVDQQVSERYATTDIQPMERVLNDTVRKVMSTPTLAQIAGELGLYKELQGSAGDLAERMLKDLSIDPINNDARSIRGVQITFTANDPHVAQAVTTRVANFFFEENQKVQGSQVESNAGYLAEQVQTKAQKLAEQEKRMNDFKRAYSGELPEQQVSNLTTLTDLRARLQSATTGLNRARDDRANIEVVIREKMTRLQAERATLLNQFTPQHDRVIRKDAEIAGVNALVELLNGSPISTQGILALATDSSLPGLRQQIETSQKLIRDFSDEEARLRTQVDEQQRRLSLVPLRDQQLTNLARDYNLVKQDYEDVRKNQLSSERAATLVQRDDSQKFRLAEPPSLPSQPSGPKRLLFAIGGLAGGLFAGLLLAVLMELQDHSFHEERSVRRLYSKVPLVLAIPTLYTQGERRKQKLWRATEWVGAAALMILVAAAEVYVYRQG